MFDRCNPGYTYSERVADPSGATVLAYLASRYPQATEAVWRERIASGRVTLDGRSTGPHVVIVPGSTLAWERPPWVEPEAPTTFTLLHEDDDVIAVDKPAGLPTLPGGGYLDNTLLALVRNPYPEAVPAHRLGRWTSGIVLFARTERARAHFGQALRDGTLWKRYRALASGRAAQTRWTIDVPIGPVPHSLLGTIHAAHPAGRRAHSEVTVLDQRADDFLADVVIATGRPHQIRIHLAACGHPLVGDPLYVTGGLPAPGSRALPGDPGYRLHAAEIRVKHPSPYGELRIVCEPPASLRYAEV